MSDVDVSEGWEILSRRRGQTRVETASNPCGDTARWGKGFCIIRKRSGFEVNFCTRARSGRAWMFYCRRSRGWGAKGSRIWVDFNRLRAGVA